MCPFGHILRLPFGALRSPKGRKKALYSEGPLAFRQRSGPKQRDSETARALWAYIAALRGALYYPPFVPFGQSAPLWGRETQTVMCPFGHILRLPFGALRSPKGRKKALWLSPLRGPLSVTLLSQYITYISVTPEGPLWHITVPPKGRKLRLLCLKALGIYCRSARLPFDSEGPLAPLG